MSEEIPTTEKTGPRGGVQVDAALFTRIEQLIQRVRLTQDEKVVVETGAVASEVHVARKEFEMGHLDQAFQAVKRLSASFDRQVAQWENLARKKEQNKQKLSMQQLRKMIAEHSGVRTRVQLVKTQVQRLRTSLDQLTNLMQRQAVTPPGPSDPEQAADAIARDRHSP